MDSTAIIAGVGLVLTYTCTVAIACMWIAGKFTALHERMVDKASWDAVQAHWRSEFKDIDRRLRQIELAAAARENAAILRLETRPVVEPIP